MIEGVAKLFWRFGRSMWRIGFVVTCVPEEGSLFLAEGSIWMIRERE